MVASTSRYLSQLTRDSLALILAGGRGSRLCELTESRAKPALHFGGKFRLIDFPLSNCVNSGIRQIGVITQYKAHSLLRHLTRGWGHLNREFGEFVELLPASQQCSSSWYQGTADALFQNIEFIKERNPKYVVVLSGDHIYKMDYGDMLAQHVESEADLTISCIEVPISEAAENFGVMCVNRHNEIINFHEKPLHPCELEEMPGFTLASMGNYVFNTDFLIAQLQQDAQDTESKHDFGNDIIPRLIKTSKVHAFRFRDTTNNDIPYWRDVGTLDSFWQSNMDLVAFTPKLNIYDEKWPIWTHQQQSPPAKFIFNDDERKGFAVDSMVSGGCIISGAQISNSLLFSDVRVECYSKVNESVILPKVTIGPNVRINRAIIDSDCQIPAGTHIGQNAEQDRARGFRITKNGIVLVTQEMLNRCTEISTNTSSENHFLQSA